MYTSGSMLGCLIILIALNFAGADDSQCTINGRKAAHVVDERFISVSLDPAFLFSGIKISSVAANLAKNMAPAFIRFAGPSTPFLKFGDDSKSISRITEGSKSLVFGPTMWWSLNAWIKHANLTPVFALNSDDDQGSSLLDLTSKMNVECYWQLGYDCDGKSEESYLEDLKSLQRLLEEFPKMKGLWKTVGGDLSSCLGRKVVDIPRKFMEDLEGVDAVMWEPEGETNGVFSEDPMNRFLSYYQPNTPVWTVAPKVEHPVTFKDAIHWAMRLGETARNGFDVIFRQPRFQELFSDTPVFWISFLHKRLMGRNVLDVKTSSLSTSDTYIYAHCSRNQNSYSIRGAMTIMVINNGTTDHTTAMKVAGTQLKNVDVRSYILTTEKINSVDTYLNGAKLSVDNLTDRPSAFDLTPKLRRAKAITHLTLSVPAKSIGFFVLPGARIPICIADEDETSLILEEMHRDQNIDFADIFPAEISSRVNTANSLTDLYRMMEKELEQDERFYKKNKKVPFINLDDWKKTQKITDASVKKLFDKTKDMMKVDFKNFLAPIDMERRNNDDKDKPKIDDMSSAEILKLLADRAKAKVEKKVGLANTDFEKTFMNKIRSKRDARGGGRGRGGRRGKKTQKRDINMTLLNEKAGDNNKSNLFRGLQKEATIRKPGQSSDELLSDAFAPAKTETVPTKIFAGFATQDDEILAPPGLPMRAEKETIFGFPNLPKKDLFGLDVNGGFPKIGLPALFGKSTTTTSKPVTKKTYVGYVKEDEPNEAYEDFDTLGDALTGYHGFHEVFGGDVTIAKPKKLDGIKELWEFTDDNNNNNEDDLLQKEFIINNAETKADVEKTIQRLENYFNNPTDKTVQDFESTFGRFKRNTGRQLKLLKSRLAQRKKLRGAKLRRFRRARNDARYHEVYTPKVNVPQMRTYESKLGRTVEWKPEDILKLSKKRNPDEANGLHEINKRHVNGDVNSVENTIDEFLNAIQKDGKSFEESGEYAIVLPTRDSISLKRKNGDTELKIHVGDSYTCPASDFSTDPSSTNAITINDDPKSTTLSSDNDFSEADVRLNSTHIQANSTGPQFNSTSVLTRSVDYVFSLNRIMASMNNLFGDLYKKIKGTFV